MPVTVQPGDTLWGLAQQLLGDGSRWRELLGPSNLPGDFDPRTLQPGTVIYISGEAGAIGGPPLGAPPPPAPAPAPTPPPSGGLVGAGIDEPAPSPTALPVQPGLTQQMEQERIALDKYIADLQADLDRAQLDIQEAQLALQEQAAEQTRILSEAQLAANPADFVAYELYKRALVEEGFQPTSAPRSDVEIQDLFSLALGLEEGGAVEGVGRFGVDIPRTGELSRSEFGAFSPTDIGLLTSFLGAGVETGPGEFQGINPADYFREVEEGFIPTIQTGRTQVRL